MADTSPYRPSVAAAVAAVVAITVSIAVSAPALARPLLPARALMVRLPGSSAALGGGLLGLPLRRRPQLAAGLAAALVAAPWLGVAGAAIARAPYMSWVGLALALAMPWSPCASRTRLIAGLVIGLGAVLARPVERIEPDASAVRPVIAYGIDAATWVEMEPMIARGELPHLAAFREAGAAGLLKSEEPSLSPRVWTIMATGQPTEVNGVVDFNSDRQNLKVGRYWDAAREAGSAVGLMEWHITWPPDEVPGFGVPGWLARGFETWPVEAAFLKKLEATGKARLPLFSLGMLRAGLNAMAISSVDNAALNLLAFAEIGLKGMGEEDSYWRIKLVQARLQTDLYFELMLREQPGCSALIIYPVDSLGHNYWKYHEPEAFDEAAFAGVTPEQREDRRDAILKAYQESDRHLGRLLQRVDLDQVHVMIVSDHGMKAAAEGGHLTGRVRASALFEVLGVGDRVNYSVAGKQLNISSKVGGEEGKRDLLRVHELLSASHMTGDPEARPFQPQPYREEMGLVVVDYHPAVIGGLDASLEIAGRVLTASDLFRTEDRSGDHTLDGIILMRGPGIAAGAEVQDADLYDMAPTLLYAMGLPVPEALPGRVLTEAFTPEALQERPVATKPGGLPEPPPARVPEAGAEDADLADQNLQDLGYVDTDEE